jgi:putative membrane protein
MMKNSTIHRNPLVYGSLLLLLGAICIAPPRALTQSPADGQTSGAAMDSQTPGTTPIPNPVDNLGHMGGVNAEQQTAIDKMFVKKAMQGSLAQVQLGELTLKKSNSDPVKQFARKMIEDHTKLNEQMRPVAQDLGVQIPTEVSKKDKSLISKMQDLSGAAYDQAYVKDMVKDHKQDLSEFHMEASNAHDSGVKDAAMQGSKTIAEHLQLAQQLAKDQNVDLAKK